MIIHSDSDESTSYLLIMGQTYVPICMQGVYVPPVKTFAY